MNYIVNLYFCVAISILVFVSFDKGINNADDATMLMFESITWPAIIYENITGR